MRCIKENLEQKSAGDSKPFRAYKSVWFVFISEFAMAQRAAVKVSNTSKRGIDR